MDEKCIQYKNDDTDWDCTRDELIYSTFNDLEFNPKKFKTFVDKEFPRSPAPLRGSKLGIQQMFVPRYTNIYHTRDNTFGNTLLYHSVGSGKTCTSIIIGATYSAAFKNSGSDQNIIVATPKSIKQSFINEIIGSNIFNCRNELKLNFGSTTDNEDIKNMKRRETMKSFDKFQRQKKIKEIKKNWNIITHHKLIEDLFKSENTIQFKHGTISKQLKNGGNLIIIDEIQNLISVSGEQYSKLSFALQNFGMNNRIILLSATPIYDQPVELGLIMNLLNPRVYFPTTKHSFDDTFGKNEALFKYMTSGYVSYFSGNPDNFPKKRMIYKYHKLGSHQINKLENFKGGLKQKYYNIFIPNTGIHKYGLLQNYSPKIKNILDSIETQEGKIFIYSDMLKHGLDPIIYFLKRTFKYNQAKGIVNNEADRFMIWTGEGDDIIKHQILKTFNSEANKDGKIIKILLGSTSIMEGVSLKAVRHVHILNPWWNESRIEQVIGRAVRQNSHNQLPDKKRFVNIYRHISGDEKLDLNYEQYIQDIANDKKKNSSKYEQWLKEVAVDCSFYKNHNRITTEELFIEEQEGYRKYKFNPSTLQKDEIEFLNKKDVDFNKKPDFEFKNEIIKCSVPETLPRVPDELLNVSTKTKEIGPQLADYLLDTIQNDSEKLKFITNFVNCIKKRMNIKELNDKVTGTNKEIKERNDLIKKIIKETSSKESEHTKGLIRMNLMKLSLLELQDEFLK